MMWMAFYLAANNAVFPTGIIQQSNHSKGVADILVLHICAAYYIAKT